MQCNRPKPGFIHLLIHLDLRFRSLRSKGTLLVVLCKYEEKDEEKRYQKNEIREEENTEKR